MMMIMIVRGPAATLLRNNLRQVVHTLLPLSPSSIIWYQRKLGSKQAYRVVHQLVSRGFAVFADAWLSGWLAEISADLRETVAHYRWCSTTMRYTNPRLLYFTLQTFIGRLMDTGYCWCNKFIGLQYHGRQVLRKQTRKRETSARAFMYSLSDTRRLPEIDANMATSWRSE